MKVISLLQPWASLVVLGHKKIETRSWNTKYRGELLIHASARFDKEQERLAFEFSQLLKDSRVYHCHRGAIIGKANLTGTETTDFLEYIESNPNLAILENWEQERAFGDYSPGRYGWLLSDPVIFDVPIAAKGKLGLWEWQS